MHLLLWPTLAVVTGISGQEPEECQPKNGVHMHQPQYHIIAPMFKRPENTSFLWPGGVNDANALYQHNGIFHMMHQCDGGPPGVPCGGGWEGSNKNHQPGEQGFYHSWGHVVSSDLVHWRRIQDALAPNWTNFEHGADCDGSISFPRGMGTAVAMYGPGCGYTDGPDITVDTKPDGSDNDKDGGGGDGDGRGRGHINSQIRSRQRRDAAVIGVALPQNVSDPYMTAWVKIPDRPVSFAQGSPPCSFAGSVWRHNDSHWSMVCSGSGTRRRYTAPIINQKNDTANTNANTNGDQGIAGPWTLVDSAFGGASADLGGGSGPAFLPLLQQKSVYDNKSMKSAGATKAKKSSLPASTRTSPQATPTHVISAGSGSTYAFGRFDDATERLVILGETKLDSGALQWSTAGSADDGRILLTGWVAGGTDPNATANGCPRVVGIAVCGVQTEAAPRVISYEQESNQLVSYPPAEMAALHNGTLYNRSDFTLPANEPHVLPIPAGTGSAVDVGISFAVPASDGLKNTTFTVTVLATEDADALPLAPTLTTTAGTGTETKTSSISAAGHSNASSVSAAVNEWTIVNNSNFVGGNLSPHALPRNRSRYSSQLACEKACSENENCKAWVYVRSANPYCALKGPDFCTNDTADLCGGCNANANRTCGCDSGIKTGFHARACKTPNKPPAPSPAPLNSGISATLTVSPLQPDGSRTVYVNSGRPDRGEMFPLLAGEENLKVRVLVDRSIVEFFFGGGRASFTQRHYPRLGETGIFLASLGNVAVVNSAVVYEMGCGWVK